MKIEEQAEFWLDVRLNEEEMNFLHDIISSEDSYKKKWNRELAGNISKSELLLDKNNWFHKNVLQDLTEKMFYRNWDAYYRYHIIKEDPLPEFELNSLWVNYMKQHEFNPPHTHGGHPLILYSFVVFMKIPTHWKEQHALPFSAHSTSPRASDFAFLVGEPDGKTWSTNFALCPSDEGRMLFFPAWLSHQVFPFYGTEEERITISGNIVWNREGIGSLHDKGADFTNASLQQQKNEKYNLLEKNILKMIGGEK